ncbi:uncharacterized protein N7498_007558 [Penicillium cinerascens]|uniref:Uncharacterized protein n=1 Tax=Penicillium cinerascens TaxID=70096 RepID=A0A9W9JLT8_9EURO|nr:uncharacterized protein N7498_007558 [Penicillium cinerascens]KAJ5198441.1 hypothetical protein N7498_007558 [Penicillium cinerascens]
MHTHDEGLWVARLAPVVPMGREGVLSAVTWKEVEWPVLEPAQGQMTGWQLPAPNCEPRRPRQWTV